MDMFSHGTLGQVALRFTRGELVVAEGPVGENTGIGEQLLALLRPAPARPPRADLAFGRNLARRVLTAIAARGVAAACAEAGYGGLAAYLEAHGVDP